METVDEIEKPEPAAVDASIRIQPASYLLELSLDWIVLRASENIHHLLGESHVTLIEEPLGRFVHAQALHDLRNLFSRLSGTTGIARAYGIRLTDEPDLVDVAFHLSDGRVLFEAVASEGSFGECFGTVGGLASGLAESHGQGLLDNGARRMRALTGYDRVTLVWGEQRAESSRGAFSSPADLDDPLPIILADIDAEPVAVFPRNTHDRAAGETLMHACDPASAQKLSEQAVRSALRIPFNADGVAGEFRCESRTPHRPNLELHAAAELFAQLFAMRLEIDRLRAGA